MADHSRPAGVVRLGRHPRKQQAHGDQHHEPDPVAASQRRPFSSATAMSHPLSQSALVAAPAPEANVAHHEHEVRETAVQHEDVEYLVEADDHAPGFGVVLPWFPYGSGRYHLPDSFGVG